METLPRECLKTILSFCGPHPLVDVYYRGIHMEQYAHVMYEMLIDHFLFSPQSLYELILHHIEMEDEIPEYITVILSSS